MFKCVGVNKGESGCKIQKVLQEISEKQRNGENVSVRVNTEPENPFDPNAVVFQALVDGKWMNIGYVVREAAPHVCYAIRVSSVGYATLYTGASQDRAGTLVLQSPRGAHGQPKWYARQVPFKFQPFFVLISFGFAYFYYLIKYTICAVVMVSP